MAFKQPALLPLTLLTNEGANCTIVDGVFQGLLDNGLRELLPAVNMLAEQVLGKGDLEWLKRRYKQMTDMFKDTWTYQTMQEMAREDAKREARKEAREEFQKRLEESEKARKQAQKQADEAPKRTLEQAIVALMSERFPKQVRFAKKLIKYQSTDHLQQLLLHLSLARNETEAENYLLHLDDDTSMPMQEKAV